MLELKSRPATSSDLIKPIRIKRSCGPDRKATPFVDEDHVLQMMWKYQESCGYTSPMSRARRGMDFLISNNRGE